MIRCRAKAMSLMPGPIRPFIPFHVPSIGDEEVHEVEAALRSGWLTTGPRTARFERDFGAYVESPHALAVNSGTAALHLALLGLGIGPGDEVITTPLTFCATVNTILEVGATPVLADVGADGNIDPQRVGERITERTKAILPVHLAGLPCEMDAIWTLARRYRLVVIEDAAHAVGSHYRGLPVGSATSQDRRSDAVAFSFYATKNLTTGEGGMVTTPHPDAYDKMRVLCLHGITADAWNRYSERGKWYYEVVDRGYKYNLSDIQSAIGIHQLRKQEHAIMVRREYARLYNALLRDVQEVEIPPDREDVRHCWHLYSLRLNLPKLAIGRDRFIEALREKGIGASVHFIPIPLHPYYAASLKPAHCPQAIELYSRLISLPLYPAMTEEQIRYVAASVQKLAAANRSQVAMARAARKPAAKRRATRVRAAG